jgi:WD40 repeat protein
VLAGHEAAVNAAAYSPDGAHIVTASADRTAQIWELQSPRAVGPASIVPPVRCPAIPSAPATARPPAKTTPR